MRQTPDAYAVSVIVPTYNRPARLRTLIDALSRQRPVSGGFEVLIIDDGSEPPIEAAALFADTSPTIRLLHAPHSGPAAARNLGARHARGPILAFTDDDCEPDPGWINGLLARHATAAEARIVGGRTVNSLPRNPFATTSQNLITIGYAHYNRDPARARFFASNNMSVSREEFLRIGGFDERFRTAEDREFCDRWQHAGLALVFEPECVVSHAHEMGLAGFLRQHFAYGRGAFRFHAMRARRHGGVKIVEWPYYRTLFTSLLPPRGAHATPLLAVSLLAAQVANLVGFFYERLRHRRAP
ncbi:MAG: glycosyltransferase [Planctomycetota bacterium]